MERPIIEIDKERCNGCGKCILDCAEGALAIVNGKAKLISDVYCDGLGACLNCPQGALTLRTRDAAPFDEAAALAAKLEREQSGGAPLAPLPPNEPMREILATCQQRDALQKGLKAQLPAWPIQLQLMPTRADYYKNADIVLAAQCAGFALPNIHEDWLRGKLPIIACPKLEDNASLVERLATIFKENEIRSLTVLRMSVPCCGLEGIAREALSAREIPWQTHVVQLK